MICFTREELQELASRTRRSAVISWLEARGIPFVPDADGWPKVLRSSILDRPALTPHPAEPQLDFS